MTWFKSDILLQNILVWLHCRKCSLKASNLWWQTFYLPVHVVFVGDKMMTNDPNWNHIICRPSIMVNLTCIICCATNISSLKILILMFQSVENCFPDGNQIMLTCLILNDAHTLCSRTVFALKFMANVVVLELNYFIWQERQLFIEIRRRQDLWWWTD